MAGAVSRERGPGHVAGLIERLAPSAAVWAVEPSGRVSWWSSRLAAFGVTDPAHQLADLGALSALAHPDDAGRLAGPLSALADRSVVFRLRGGDSPSRWVRLQATEAVGDDGTALWLGVLDDVSAQLEGYARVELLRQLQLVSGAWRRGRTVTWSSRPAARSCAVRCSSCWPAPRRTRRGTGRPALAPGPGQAVRPWRGTGRPRRP